MRIIGFGHRKRVGKDTATKFAMSFMRQQYPRIKCYVLSFGDQIKEISYCMYGWAGLQPGVHYENNPKEKEIILPRCGKSPRQIWDIIGLMGRDISSKTWIELGMAIMPVEADILFCKDVRSKPEVDLIHKFNGVAVKITKQGVPLGGPVDDLGEQCLWDYTIRNDGTLKDLNNEVKILCARKVEEWQMI